LRIRRTALSVQQIFLPSSRCSVGPGFSSDSWLTIIRQIHSFPFKRPCSFSQACQYSDVTVSEWFSLLCAVWLLSSISSLTPFDRSTTAIRRGLEVGITRACVHVSLRGTGVCEPPGASQPKATAMMWLVRNRASVPVNICRHDAAPGAARSSGGFPAAENLLVVGYRTFLNC
jgi:hypothetical protein